MTTTLTTGPGSNPNTTGANDADAKAKVKAELDAKKEKKRRRRQRENDKKYSTNKHNGIMKEVTISPGSSAKMTLNFRIFKKSAVAYAVAKGYKHWPGVIESLEPMPDQNVPTRIRKQ